ncbi:Glycosyltransferase, catalytic subunit of cellulose synthase and poly-beta-1,6-N-acetylglucosamine synthase [Nocardioides scoriae]|uniref:Glycosyltransferase, catalytic subunit of cellulose synthase and poly-beta-1,6-N-acetylglucosamine synthase n=1 Tax=Nocardioides scoriae TaxID=642780 RepID=A0A1H1LJE4_9ACTN|nr:Glycosyltransferase, catalytic subunit of cellulose synthase and poly-beta-1,6-N-acetylglucosamine synthase [Nocardioides scoriae]
MLTLVLEETQVLPHPPHLAHPTPTRRRPRHRRALAVLGLPVASLAASLAMTVPAAEASASTTTQSISATATSLVPVAAAPDVAAADDDQLLPPGQQAPAEPSAPDRSSTTDTSGPTDSPTSWLGVLGLSALLAVSLLMTVVALTTLWWMLHAWRSTQSLGATRFSTTTLPPQRSFSLMVPARHEEAVLAHTIDELAKSDHPDFEILVLIGHDDPTTEAVARDAERRHPGLVRVVIDHSVPKNKPRAMNTALPHVTKDVVGVFDAEDEVHPRLLGLVDSRFTETGADLVQGGVQLMNVQSSWWSLRNCLEYYFWFRSRLHFHAEARFIPLGGNTVFVRTDLLRAAGGWDGDCLAEDCELGVRLSTRGARVAVAYDPEVVTREETPGSLTSLFKQRTRWSQGFLQVLKKGAWKELPTRRQRALARYTLAMPFLQAFTGLMIPVSVLLALFAKVPTIVAMATFLPVVPTLVTLVVEAAGLGEFARSYRVKVRFRDYLKLVLGTFPYQVFLAAAAIRAAWREFRGDSSWEKTEHTGAHVNPTPHGSPEGPVGPSAEPTSEAGTGPAQEPVRLPRQRAAQRSAEPEIRSIEDGEHVVLSAETEHEVNR